MQIDNDGRTPADDAERDAKTTSAAVAEQGAPVSLADEPDADEEDAAEQGKEREGAADDEDGSDDAQDKPRKRSQSQAGRPGYPSRPACVWRVYCGCGKGMDRRAPHHAGDPDEHQASGRRHDPDVSRS